LYKKQKNSLPKINVEELNQDISAINEEFGKWTKKKPKEKNMLFD
jgi:hypothetical protein